MPPDIRDYLQVRVALPSNFSPDGDTLLVQSDLSGTHQLYRVALEGGVPEPVTAFSEPVTGAYLPTSRRIVVSMDEGGNERHQIYAIDEDGRNLERRVFDPDFIHHIGGVSRDGRWLCYASNRRNGTDFDVYVHDLEGPGAGAAADRSVFAPGGWCRGAGFSPDGRWLAVARLTDRSMDNELHLIDLDSPESAVEVAPHKDDAAIGPPRWLPDSSGFFFASDVDRDRTAIARQRRGGSFEYAIERDGDLACWIDWNGRSLAVVTSTEGYTHPELVDPHTLERRCELALPHDGVASSFSFSRDGRWLAYQFASPLEPGDVWICDTGSGQSRRLTQSPCPLDKSTLVVPSLERFSSFDGESVPVFAYAPKNAESGRLPPVVAQIHGGPEGQARPLYHPVIAYLVARGYGVVVPNVRGSVGYGKRYHHLDDRRLRLDAVRDLEALHDWLRASGRFDASRAALLGGSYGGYMVLSGLAYQPDRWAAAVDICGNSSLKTFLENTSAWRRKAREREYGSLEEDGEFLTEIAPLTHVDRMRAPLFIIHGRNDPRVPLSESEQIHDALLELGVPCELLVYDDEGHGLGKLVNRLDAYPRAADFLDAALSE